MNKPLVILTCALSLAWATGRADGAVKPSALADDETISISTFCIAKVREVLRAEHGITGIKIRITDVLHRAGPSPNTWRGRWSNMVQWFRLHPGTTLTVSPEFSGWLRWQRMMALSEGDTVLVVLTKREKEIGLMYWGNDLMPGSRPLCPITGPNDPAVLHLKRVLDLSDQLDPAKKFEGLIRALREEQNVVVVDYAFNTLLEKAQDPALKDRICDELLRSLSRLSLMLAADGQAWEVYRINIAFTNAYQHLDSGHNEMFRKELMKIRDAETMPMRLRLMADGGIAEIVPSEYAVSLERIAFLKEMLKRPGIEGYPRKELESRLQSIERFQRERADPTKLEPEKEARNPLAPEKDHQRNLDSPRVIWQPPWPRHDGKQ